MGTRASKEISGGTLKGAYPPAVEGVTVPKSKWKPAKLHNITVPRTKNGGDLMEVNIDGQKKTLRIPTKFSHQRASRFTHYEPGDVGKVVASTLSSVPGHEIVSTKPIVFATVTSTIVVSRFAGKPTHGQELTKLIQSAQDQILSLAIQHDCNAVLGIQYNIINESNGETKFIIVNAFGTPCYIVPCDAKPAMDIRMTKEMFYCDGAIGTSTRSLYSLDRSEF